MKLYKVYASALFFYCLSSPLFAQSVRAAVGPWPPYHLYHEKSGDLMSGKVKKILEKEKIFLDIYHTSWSRAQYQLDEKAIDLSLSWVKNPEREKHFAFSLPIGSSRSVFYSKSNQFDNFDSLENFKKVKIGLVRGYAVDQDLQSFLKRDDVLCDYAKNDRQNLMRLLGNRVDLILIDQDVAQYYLNHDMLERKYEVHQLDFFCWTQDLHVMISKKRSHWPEFLEKINRAIQNSQEFY